MVSKICRFMMKVKLSTIVLLLSAFIIGGIPGESIGASEKERISKLIEGAKLEGKMVLYTTHSMTASLPMIKKFEDKYPFVKVELYRSGSETLQNKIINEAKANKYIPDVIEIPGFNAFILKQAGLTASYISPENRVYQEGFKDSDGFWTGTYVNLFGMGYNTKLLSRKDIPDTYEGFLNPKWKGKKIGFFGNKEVEWFANMLKIMGEEKGMDFFRKFVAQGLDIRNGQSLITDLMIAGEFPVGTTFPHIVADKKKKGAPVDWVGIAPIIAKLGTNGLAAHASHPNAAKLWIDLALSREGQMILLESGRLPARLDIEADILKEYKRLKIYPTDMSLADKFTAYSKLFIELLRSDRSI